MRRGAASVFLALFCFAMAACADRGGAARPTEAQSAAVRRTSSERPTSPGGPPAKATSRWRLFAVGDVKLDRTERAGIDPFARVSPSLGQAQVTVANGEMAIARGGNAQPKTFTFRAPPSAAGRLARAGIDVLSLANNHAGDYGTGALLETIEHLRAAGVVPVGAGTDAARAYAPWSDEVVPGVRLAVMSASRVLPSPGWEAGQGPGVASAYRPARLVRAVRAAAASHDVVVVVVHWGTEGSPCPNESQRRLADELLRAGATVVLGAHPHVLQPIVEDRRGLVAYSLGNFVFDKRSGRSGDSGVLELSFEGARLASHRFHPHVLASGVPTPAPAGAARRIRASVSAPCG